MTLRITRTNPATHMVEITNGNRTWQALGQGAEQAIREHVERIAPRNDKR